MRGRYFLSDLLLLFLSSALFYLAGPNIFSPTGYPVFAWVFAVPLFFVLDKKNLWQRLICGIVFALAAYLMILSWVANVNGFLFIFFSLLFSMQPVFFVIIFKSNHPRPITRCILWAASWVLTEALRTFLIGGYAWTIGHSQTYLPVFIQIADISGAYGISFLIILVNACVFFSLKNKRNLLVCGTVAVCSLTGLILYGTIRMQANHNSKDAPYSICAIQPDITSEEKFNPDLIDHVADKHIALARQCVKRYDPDLIVWPETAMTDDFLRDAVLRQKVSSLSHKIQTPMLIGSALLFKGKSYNSAVLLDRDARLRGIYHKRYLLPFNEYFPLKRHFEFFQKKFHIKNHDFKSAVGDVVLPIIKNYGNIRQVGGEKYFGVVICSEEGYPSLLRDQVRSGAELVICMLNNKWFQSEAAMMMHAQNGIMAAASFKRPVLRVTNSGLTCLIDKYGRIVFPQKPQHFFDQQLIFNFDVHLSSEETMYKKFGDVLIYFCLIIMLATFFKKPEDGKDT